MSRFHRENPDYEETGAQPPDPRDAWDSLDHAEKALRKPRRASEDDPESESSVNPYTGRPVADDPY